MSSSRTKKSGKGRGHAAVSEADQFRARKEENFQLHDEADLVNFRAEALKRYISNQDLLENVTLKLIHTARLIPPPSFPQQSANRLYDEKTATEDELIQYVKNMKVGELFSGDLRLMRAKEKLLKQEIAEIVAEQLNLSENDVLSEELRFQKAAIEALAAAQMKCTDVETFLELEHKLEQTVQEYEQRFAKNYVLDERTVRKHAIATTNLAPNIDVKQAPADYDPRLIMSFIDIKNKHPANGNNTGSQSETTPLQTADQDGRIHDNTPMEESRFANAGEYMGDDDDVADGFGMLIGDGDQNPENNNGDELPYDPQLTNSAGLQESESGAYNGKDNEKNPEELAAAHQQQNGVHPENLETLANDVDMDDLDQFLAAPDAGVDMDGIDALMDFDQQNEHTEVMRFDQGSENEAPGIDDDPFSVDFLRQMGNELE